MLLIPIVVGLLTAIVGILVHDEGKFINFGLSRWRGAGEASDAPSRGPQTNHSVQDTYYDDPVLVFNDVDAVGSPASSPFLGQPPSLTSIALPFPNLLKHRQLNLVHHPLRNGNHTCDISTENSSLPQCPLAGRTVSNSPIQNRYVHYLQDARLVVLNLYQKNIDRLFLSLLSAIVLLVMDKLCSYRRSNGRKESTTATTGNAATSHRPDGGEPAITLTHLDDAIVPSTRSLWLSHAQDDISPSSSQSPTLPDESPCPADARNPVGRIGLQHLRAFAPNQLSTPRRSPFQYPSPISIRPIARVTVADRFAYAAMNSPVADHWRNRIPSPLSEINADTDTDWRGGGLD